MPQNVGLSSARRQAGLAPWLGALALTLAAQPVAAQDRDDRDDARASFARVNGRWYEGWAVAWWRWAYSLPVTRHPLFDPTGADCGRGQSGRVWFLGWSLGGEASVERTCEVPAGRFLFFPVLASALDNVGVTPPRTVPQMRAALAGAYDQAADLHVVIDGVRVENLARHRVQPPVFSYTVPRADNLYQHTGIEVSGTIRPVVTDGFWVMLPPLPPGRHELRFGGALPSVMFSIEATYHLVVAPDDDDDDRR